MASKKGAMRSTTLSDARKMGLYPSVTTIMRLLDKPNLTAWRIEQAVLSALTLPATPGESLDDRARRIVKDADEQVTKASALGHLVHDAIEEYVTKGCLLYPDPKVHNLIKTFIEWWNHNCTKLHYAEKTVVHAGYGYAGRLDCKAEIKGRGICIIDFKCRKPSKDGGRCYPEDAMQLSAYKEADALTSPNTPETCLSIILNSEEPGLFVKEWPKDEIIHSFECFRRLCDLWKCLKKYDPTCFQK